MNPSADRIASSVPCKVFLELRGRSYMVPPPLPSDLLSGDELSELAQVVVEPIQKVFFFAVKQLLLTAARPDSPVVETRICTLISVTQLKNTDVGFVYGWV